MLLEKKGMTDQADCDEVDELTEFIGFKLKHSDECLCITQPVLMQSFMDEFDFPEVPVPVTPAEPGFMLMNSGQQRSQRSGK